MSLSQRTGSYGIRSDLKISSKKSFSPSSSWLRIRRNSPEAAPWMTRWSYVEVSVMTLEMPSLFRVSCEVPWNSAG